MSRAALIGRDVAATNQIENVARLKANILYALMARYLIGNAAEHGLEVGVQCITAVPRPKILEGVIESLLHFEHVRIFRIHERELLLVHQDAGGNRCRKVISFINEFG